MVRADRWVFGGPKPDLSADLGESPGNRDRAAEEVNVVDPQAGCLAEPEPGIRGCEHHDPVARVDGCCQVVNLGEGEDRHVGPFDGTKAGAAGEWRLRKTTVVDRLAEDAAEDLVRLAYGGGSLTNALESGNPLSDSIQSNLV